MGQESFEDNRKSHRGKKSGLRNSVSVLAGIGLAAALTSIYLYPEGSRSATAAVLPQTTPFTPTPTPDEKDVIRSQELPTPVPTEQQDEVQEGPTFQEVIIDSGDPGRVTQSLSRETGTGSLDFFATTYLKVVDPNTGEVMEIMQEPLVPPETEGGEIEFSATYTSSVTNRLTRLVIPNEAFKIVNGGDLYRDGVNTSVIVSLADTVIDEHGEEIPLRLGSVLQQLYIVVKRPSENSKQPDIEYIYGFYPTSEDFEFEENLQTEFE